jgi:hypothetical protein
MGGLQNRPKFLNKLKHLQKVSVHLALGSLSLSFVTNTNKGIL